MKDPPLSLMFDEAPLPLAIWLLHGIPHMLRLDPTVVTSQWDSDEESQQHPWQRYPDAEALREAFEGHGLLTVAGRVEFLPFEYGLRGTCFIARWDDGGGYFIGLGPAEGLGSWQEPFAKFGYLLSDVASVGRFLGSGTTVRIGLGVTLPDEVGGAVVQAVCRQGSDIRRLFDQWLSLRGKTS